jgi:hypothetical protein
MSKPKTPEQPANHPVLAFTRARPASLQDAAVSEKWKTLCPVIEKLLILLEYDPTSLVSVDFVIGQWAVLAKKAAAAARTTE